jgi:hypothetical protein
VGTAGHSAPERRGTEVVDAEVDDEVTDISAAFEGILDRLQELTFAVDEVSRRRAARRAQGGRST